MDLLGASSRSRFLVENELGLTVDLRVATLSYEGATCHDCDDDGQGAEEPDRRCL